MSFLYVTAAFIEIFPCSFRLKYISFLTSEDFTKRDLGQCSKKNTKTDRTENSLIFFENIQRPFKNDSLWNQAINKFVYSATEIKEAFDYLLW